jgi:hypothetical protein
MRQMTRNKLNHNLIKLKYKANAEEFYLNSAVVFPNHQLEE